MGNKPSALILYSVLQHLICLYVLPRHGIIPYYLAGEKVVNSSELSSILFRSNWDRVWIDVTSNKQIYYSVVVHIIRSGQLAIADGQVHYTHVKSWNDSSSSTDVDCVYVCVQSVASSTRDFNSNTYVWGALDRDSCSLYCINSSWLCWIYYFFYYLKNLRPSRSTQTVPAQQCSLAEQRLPEQLAAALLLLASVISSSSSLCSIDSRRSIEEAGRKR